MGSGARIDPKKKDQNEDSDKDGYTNIEEYLNCTDPKKFEESFTDPDFEKVLAQIAELNEKAKPRIDKVVKEERRVEAERQFTDITASVGYSSDRKKADVKIADVGEMPMVLISAGSFLMGSPTNEEFRTGYETQHKVSITKPYYLGVYTVTRAQFAAVMKKSKVSDSESVLPVTTRWNEASWFCRNLSNATGRKFRLATEAEWEYACRAGTTTPFSTGKTISTEQANFNGDRVYGAGKKGKYRDQFTAPGDFPPNAWGVADMHGNFLNGATIGARPIHRAMLLIRKGREREHAGLFVAEITAAIPRTCDRHRAMIMTRGWISHFVS